MKKNKNLRILETSRTSRQKQRFLKVINNQKLRILEITTYTAGGCGVGARVLHEAALLAQKGHNVTIFSTNHVKGAPRQTAPREERHDSVVVRRFPATKLGGESFTSWNFEKELLALKPEVIIAHAFRHTHTTRALCIAKKRNIPVLLVTHAPFNTGNESRSLLAKAAIAFYDSFIGRTTLRQFSRIITITHWERPCLHRLGVPNEKMSYIPNGIPRDFFTQKPSPENKEFQSQQAVGYSLSLKLGKTHQGAWHVPSLSNPNKVLYFGRLAPVKDLETLIRALSLMKNRAATLELAGPAESRYFSKLKSLIAKLHLESRVSFTPAIYDLKKKIAKLDSARVFVLPSKREGMPQSLIEALARKKLVIASDNLGNKDLIQHNKNGFLFSIGDAPALAAQLDAALSLPEEKARQIQKAARASVRQFAWPRIIKKLEVLLHKVAAKNGV